MSQHAHIFPRWLKIGWTAFVAVLTPVYWLQYGPANYLWFSDIALFASVAALWLEHRLLASIMALAVVMLELAWNIDFFGRFVLGDYPIGLAAYMSDANIPLFVRGLSLFHIVLPPLLLWMVYQLGYDRHALIAQTALAWIVLPVTYLLTDPSKNINWVFGLGKQRQTWLPPVLYLLALMIAFPALVYLPTHLVLRWLFSRPRAR